MKIVLTLSVALVISSFLIPSNTIQSVNEVEVKQQKTNGHILFNKISNDSISWKAWHFGKTNERYGKVPIIKAECYTKRKKLKGGKFEFSIENLTVENFGESKEKEYLTNHLKSADFFQTDSFPKAYFEISKVKKSRGEFSHLISGNLKIKNISRNIALPCNFIYHKDSLTFNFKPFEINRNDWGITYNNSENELINKDYLIADEIEFNIGLSIKKIP